LTSDMEAYTKAKKAKTMYTISLCFGLKLANMIQI